MGDGLKLSKDKRHKSSSSIAGGGLEGTRSERKLDIRGPIAEVDDQFTLAETRCDDLQEKLDLVKVLRKKRKLKKRSMTRVNEQPVVAENIHTPLISIRTQPKKKVSQQGTRLRRLEAPPNPTRGYLDPATLEQHRMLGHVWGYGPHYQAIDEYPVAQHKTLSKAHPRRARADGDGMCGQSIQIGPAEVACGQDDDMLYYSDNDMFQGPDDFLMRNVDRVPTKPLMQKKRINNLPRVNNINQVPKRIDTNVENNRGSRANHSRLSPNSRQEPTKVSAQKSPQPQEDRPLVELFNKSRSCSPTPNIKLKKKDADKRPKKQTRESTDDQITLPSEEAIPSKKDIRHPRRVKYRSRGYEMPTVASQMKQTDIRYRIAVYNRSNIPFVVSKSTAPSHNIGVNIQQVLNGLKVQQPLSGIPLTIAHHMGLGHVPTFGAKSVTTQPSLDNREINAIKLGRRLLVLPSYKYMSYNRLLSLYREGDGMVPRFLRAISRPHYFYTSMYNLATHREDFDGATSKGRAGHDTRQQQLTEYTQLYHEYERVDKRLKEGHNPDLERRRDDLLRELAVREDQIKKLVQESSRLGDTNLASLRASASAADDNYRHSSYKLNMADQ